MSANFVIRDALESDIPACLAVDTACDTDYVWKIQMREEGKQRHLTFVTDHLPRTMSVSHLVDEARLFQLLPEDQCFLVLTDRQEPDVLGFLTMQADPVRQMGWIHDIVVLPELRRRGIARRLFRIASQWAGEHNLTTLTLVTQTKNYPSIMFSQKNGLVFCGFNDHYFSNQDIALFFGKSVR